MALIHCARCSEELTVPYYHNGQAYGWTCIETVSPDTSKHHKNTKFYALPLAQCVIQDRGKGWIVAKALNILWDNPMVDGEVVIVFTKDKKIQQWMEKKGY